VPDSGDPKVSREQADSAAEALIGAALQKQQQDAEQNTLPLVRLFPGLAQVPPMERQAVLAQAREDVKDEWAPKLLLALIGLLLAAALAFAFNGHLPGAIGTGVAALGLGIVRQAVELTLVRWRLRERNR
jgi:hypothetical protein